MRKLIRWMIFVVFALAIVAAALYGISRYRGASPEQRAALSLLEERAPLAGANAFASLWLLPFDVPQEQRDRIVIEDAKRFLHRRALSPLSEEAEGSEPFVSVAAERYPEVRHENARRHACDNHPEGCLAAVRSDPDHYAGHVQQNAKLLARVAALADYQHYRNLLPEGFDLILPPFQYLFWTLSESALAFVQGEVDRGLTAACRDVSIGRMLASRSDSLIAGMIGAALIDRNSRLVADMLAELPMTHALPAMCETAFALPHSDEFSLCPHVRGEIRLMRAGMRELGMGRGSLGDRWMDRLFPLFFDAEMTAARMASRMAWYCGEEAIAQRVSDRAVSASLPKQSNWSLECASNLVGCLLSSDSFGINDSYQHRLQDAAAQIDLMATLLWLREREDHNPLPERIKHRPSHPDRSLRDVRIGDDGNAVAIDLHFSRDQAEWILPLPASRTSATP